MHQFDFHDIQGLVMNAYGHLRYSRFELLRIVDCDAAKRWLASVTPEITSARRRHAEEDLPGAHMNLAFTASGLQALRLTSDVLATFPRAFLMGMAAPERSRKLGDLGDNAPEYWEFGGPSTPEIHILLMLYGRDETILEELAARVLGASPATSGIEEVFRQNSVKESENEPFGFRDGISQPAIEGVPHKALPGQAVLKPGEFILGYVDEYEDIIPVPTVSREQDLERILPPDPAQPGRGQLGHNGSFLVLRKLRQDVAGFWNFLDRATRNTDGSGDPERKNRLAAKMIGRWPSGAPLVLAPEKDNPELGRNKTHNNNFGFAATDPDGFACPVGSHIRRSNPRDALAFPAAPNRSLAIANRHRILRRGRPYREVSPDTGEVIEQGLLFVAINADLQRQFEFIQQSWLNSPKFNGLYDERDPLSSAGDGNGTMTIQAKPVRDRVHGIPRFVTMRGGAYFFLPSIKALNFLAKTR